MHLEEFVVLRLPDPPGVQAAGHVGMAIAQVDRELDNVAIIRQIKREKTTRLDKD